MEKHHSLNVWTMKSQICCSFPVTNELLEDSDANIAGTLISWIGDESRVTRNKIILDVIKKKKKHHWPIWTISKKH